MVVLATLSIIQPDVELFDQKSFFIYNLKCMVRLIWWNTTLSKYKYLLTLTICEIPKLTDEAGCMQMQKDC